MCETDAQVKQTCVFVSPRAYVRECMCTHVGVNSSDYVEMRKDERKAVYQRREGTPHM